LLGQRVHKLGKNLVGDNGLSKLIGVVGKTAKSESSGLLNWRNVIEEKGAEKSHNT
jgi:hypothetical protein